MGLVLVPDLPLRLRQALVIKVFVSLPFIVGRFAIAGEHHRQSLRQEQTIADDFHRRAKPFDTF